MIAIRDAVDGDLVRLHALNADAAPGVGPVTRDELAHLVAIGGPTRVAVVEGRIAGFILCMTEGLDYASPNYLWLAARYPSFAYNDRIAIDAAMRGRGIGERLYHDAFSLFSGKRCVMVCEVNLAPPNPGSLRFHHRLGFAPVGELWSADRTKGVVFLERQL